MFKRQKKLSLNLKILRLFFISPFFVLIPFFFYVGNVKAGLEFQWDQDSIYRKLNWFQKESKRSIRNTTYFFLRPFDRKNDLLKIDLAIPKTFKSTLKLKNIKLCKVEIGGFEGRTKCLEDVPADLEILNEESSLRKLIIYPYSPLPVSKDNYAIVIKALNPRRSGLYQFHSFGQPAGKSASSYLGSWTIVID